MGGSDRRLVQLGSLGSGPPPSGAWRPEEEFEWRIGESDHRLVLATPRHTIGWMATRVLDRHKRVRSAMCADNI